MKVRILSSCYVDGKPCVAGDEVETAKHAILIGTGKAEKFVEPEAPAKDPIKQPEKAAVGNESPVNRAERPTLTRGGK